MIRWSFQKSLRCYDRWADLGLITVEARLHQQGFQHVCIPDCGCQMFWSNSGPGSSPSFTIHLEQITFLLCASVSPPVSKIRTLKPQHKSNTSLGRECLCQARIKRQAVSQQSLGAGARLRLGAWEPGSLAGETVCSHLWATRPRGWSSLRTA